MRNTRTHWVARLLRVAAPILIVLLGEPCELHADPKPDSTQLRTGPVEIIARPILDFDKLASVKRRFGQLEWRGGLELSSPSSAFGGWSGMALDAQGKALFAISDAGTWMTAELVYIGNAPTGLTRARIGPIKGLDGGALRRDRDRDAEGVAVVSGTAAKGSLLISFEQHHRIGRFDIDDAGLSLPESYAALSPEVRRMPVLKGFEAIAVLHGGVNKGSMIAIAERRHDVKGNHTGWIFVRGEARRFSLTDIGGFDITDAASLDDGSLLVLERRFRWLEGVKMRLRLIRASELRPGATISGDVVMEAGMSQQVDNMEALAVHTAPDGATVVTLMSDNNFNPVLQRNLLLQFTLRKQGVASQSSLRR